MHVMAIKAIVRLRQSRKLGGTPGDDSVKGAILKPVYRGIMGSSMGKGSKSDAEVTVLEGIAACVGTTRGRRESAGPRGQREGRQWELERLGCGDSGNGWEWVCPQGTWKSE